MRLRHSNSRRDGTPPTPRRADGCAVPDDEGVHGVGPDWAFCANPAKMVGVTHLSNDAAGSKYYDSSISWWQLWDGVKNHSTYLDEGTETLADISRVVGGVR